MWKNKTALVLGGTGLVGSHCVEQLLERGCNVKIVLHERPNIFDDKVETVNGDLTNRETCFKLINNVDFVIHAAAQSGGLGRNLYDPLSTLIPNARMNLNVLEAIEKNPPEVFHFCSNNSIYPDVSYPVKEDDIFIPSTGIASHYSQLKILGENHCRYLFDMKKIKISITRGANAYGPNDNFDPVTSHTIPANIRKVVERQNPLVIWANGTGIRDYIHARDLAEGILLCMENHPKADPVNIATGKSTSVNDLIKLLCDLDDFHNPTIKHDPTKPGGPKAKLLNFEKAKKILGYETKISLKDGLKETIDWFKNKNL